MYIDPRIAENAPTIPTFGRLEPGQTFIYSDELYLKIDDWTAVCLSDATLCPDGDIASDTGVLPVKVKIVSADD